MKLQVTDRGLLIPKELLGKSHEVELSFQGDRIIITPTGDTPSIWDLGKNPVECDVTGAASDPDRYLYGQ
ncbi:hypothetical protein V0288_06760 [Pannus brasiliensis CCIBt3594]|uniref:AbrB-like protein n=1 Tax=Pannus brasiliensis CCIBt3594 TaxID=1427578 RepID=A0AAW9QGB5_9CHRO